MGGDDYVITSNSKHTDAHKAAHDLDEQVTRLREENKLLREKLRELWRTQDPDAWDETFAQEVSALCKD